METLYRPLQMNNDKKSEHYTESVLPCLQQDLFKARTSHTPPSQSQERKALPVFNLWQALFTQVRITTILIGTLI